MCEYCNKSETTVEKLEPDEEGLCEWISEEAGPGACAAMAVCSVSAWYVEDHLCDTHRQATEKEMGECLGKIQGNVVHGRRVPKYESAFPTMRIVKYWHG